MEIKYNIAIDNCGLLTLNYAAEVLSVFDLLADLEYTVIGWD